MIDFSDNILEHFERGKIVKTVYENGAVYVHHRTPKIHSAYLSVSFFVGSRDEKKNEAGLAHLLEHMIFKGGSAIKGSELLMLMESMGAEINAFTSKETISFELNCLNTDLKKIFPLFIDLILSPRFDQTEFEREKNVVLQEIREERDDYELEAEERLFEKCFDFDLGHPITGSLKSVSSFKPKHLHQFYQEHFTPPKMVVSIVGDVLPHRYQEELAKLFTKFNLKKKAKPYRRKRELNFGKINHFSEILKRDSENPYLFMTLKGFPFDSQYRGDALILNHYLSEGMSSRFFKALREEEGLVYGISSYLNSFIDNGSLVISFTSQPKNILKVRNKVRDIFGDIAINGISEERLMVCKKQIMTSFLMAFDDPEEINQHMARGELYRGRILSLKEIKNMVHQATPESIKFVTQELLKDGISQLVLK